MTHTTPDPLREALAFYTDDANWRQNGPLDPNSANFSGGPARAALAAAPQLAKKQTMCDRCDGSGYVWAVGNCPKCEGSGWVSSAPQPVPAPTRDERSARIAVIHKVLDGPLRPTDIADTILAAGYRKADGLRTEDRR